MSQLIDIETSLSSPEAGGLDASQCVDLFFPSVDDLLHRLADTRAESRPAPAPKLFGSWKIAAACAIGLICVPGASAAAILLIKADKANTPPVKTEQSFDPVSARGDRLPLIVPATVAAFFRDSDYFDEAKMRDDDEPFEQPDLRGSVEDAVVPVAAAEPPAPVRRKPRRNIQATLVTVPTEAPEPRAPSLVEKLFSVFVPQFSQPPSQRQS